MLFKIKFKSSAEPDNRPSIIFDQILKLSGPITDIEIIRPNNTGLENSRISSIRPQAKDL